MLHNSASRPELKNLFSDSHELTRKVLAEVVTSSTSTDSHLYALSGLSTSEQTLNLPISKATASPISESNDENNKKLCTIAIPRSDFTTPASQLSKSPYVHRQLSGKTR